jgi:enamine deaminase RidA (YjgF/YER057c/UK114 family)
MTVKHLPLLAVALIGSLAASAQKTKQIPLPASQNPLNADVPVSAAVWAGDTLYVSGWLDPDLKTHTGTTSQTVGLIKDVQKLLESQKLTLSDVVMIHVYLGGDPRKTARWTLPE